MTSAEGTQLREQARRIFAQIRKAGDELTDSRGQPFVALIEFYTSSFKELPPEHKGEVVRTLRGVADVLKTMNETRTLFPNTSGGVRAPERKLQ
jgi:hypothetical protein